MLISLILLASPAFASEGGMSLVPDPVLIVLQAIPFFVSMFILHSLVFKPMIAYLQDREAATVGAQQQALKLRQDAELRLAEYEAKLSRARAEIGTVRAEARAAALVKREEVLAVARREAEARVADAREIIVGERELASQELSRMSRGLARDIASKILGRELAA